MKQQDTAALPTPTVGWGQLNVLSSKAPVPPGRKGAQGDGLVPLPRCSVLLHHIPGTYLHLF